MNRGWDLTCVSNPMALEEISLVGMRLEVERSPREYLVIIMSLIPSFEGYLVTWEAITSGLLTGPAT